MGETQFTGLTDTNKRAVFNAKEGLNVGDFVVVKVTDASQNTLFSEATEKLGVLEFHEKYRGL